VRSVTKLQKKVKATTGGTITQQGREKIKTNLGTHHIKKKKKKQKTTHPNHLTARGKLPQRWSGGGGQVM